MSKDQVVGLIPARFNSERFPGKPLAQILGKSLIQRTYENALLAKSLTDLAVVTDDERIFHHVESFGGVALMSDDHASGTERIAKAAECHYQEAEIVINIQGDEPCIDPAVIDDLVEGMRHSNAEVMTPVTRLNDPEMMKNPSVVKCVFDQNKRALYFSRQMIPARKDGGIANGYRHLGIYAFRKGFLSRFIEMLPSPLQQIEDLEQLKILEHGVPIDVRLVGEQAIGVDCPEDITKIERSLCQENIYS